MDWSANALRRNAQPPSQSSWSSTYPRGNDLSLLASTTEGTDGRRFVLLHVVDFRLELDLPRFHPIKRLHNPV